MRHRRRTGASYGSEVDMLAGPSHVPRDGEFDASELRRADRVWLLGQLGPITARRIPSPASSAERGLQRTIIDMCRRDPGWNGPMKRLHE